MRNIKRLLLVLFISSASFSFGQSMFKIQSDLEFHFQKVDFWRSRMALDSTIAEDSILRNRLLYYTNEYPATMKENFKYLKYYDHMTVLTSDDNSFRIYGWDDGNPDHHNFINVFQYQDSNKKIESSLIMPGTDAETLKGREYRKLFTMKAKGRIYYLATYITPINKTDYTMGVEVFSKNSKGGLNDSTDIIVNNTYGTAVNHLEFDMSEASGATNHSIYFNKQNKMLYVPIIWKNGVVSTAYTMYKFKNNYFTEVKPEMKK